MPTAETISLARDARSSSAGANGNPLLDEPSFSEVLNGISALVACLRPDGSVETVNRHVTDYFGKTLEELKEWSSTDAVHPDDLPHVLAVSKRSFETGEPYDVDLRQRRADGAYRWFHVQGLPVRGADGQINRWCVLQTDIEDRKRAEDALRKDERELATAIETIPALVLSFLPDGTVDFVSHRWLDYVGHSREEMFPTSKPLSPALGGAWKSTNHPDDLDRALNKWQAALATGEPLELETRYRRADGHYRWFLVRSVPLRDEIGQIVKWYATFTDVDDRKRAEDALRSTQTRLSRAKQVATVAELSASIAHEINQPLASVVTNAHAAQTWLSHDPPNLERAQVTLERIIRDGHSAGEVVQRIRALFKEAPPVKAPVDVNGIVAEVLRVLSDDLCDHGIIVEADFETDLPMIEADHVQIQQTLINLVHNATEAMDGVTDRAKSLLLSTRRQGEELLIQVRDHGIGSKDSTLMFEPFFTTKDSGMGMGLSICRTIIEAHGGRVWAIANEDAGMTFSFTLPTLSGRP